MSQSTPPLSFLLLNHRRGAHTHRHTQNRAAAVSQPLVCEACWCQYRGALSVSYFTCLSATCPCLVGSSSDELCRSILFSFNSVSLSPYRWFARSLPLCYTHSLLIWSSVGQRGSSESRECWQAGWLMKNTRRVKSCTGSQVLLRCATGPKTKYMGFPASKKHTNCQNVFYHQKSQSWLNPNITEH